MTRDVVSDWENVSHQGGWLWDDDRFDIISEYPIGTCLRLGERADVRKSDGFIPTDYYAARLQQNVGAPFTIRGPLSNLEYRPSTGSYHRRQWVYTGLHGLPNASYYKEALVGQYFDAGLEAAAKSKCLTRVGSQFNAGTFLGELPTSLNMVASRAISIVQALHYLRKGDVKRAAAALADPSLGGARSGTKARGPSRSRLTTVANGYLEWKYGWRPLLGDIFNMVESIKEAMNLDKNQLVRIKATTTSRQFDATHPGDMQWSGSPPLKGCQVIVWYRIQQPRIAALNSLGLINPWSLAWELTPLSFVLDWFIPIGAFLSNLTATLGLSFETGCVTRFARGSGIVTWSPANWQGFTGEFPTVNVKLDGMRRQLLTTWPRNDLYISTGLNFSQTATLLALLQQRRG